MSRCTGRVSHSLLHYRFGGFRFGGSVLSMNDEAMRKLAEDFPTGRATGRHQAIGLKHFFVILMVSCFPPLAHGTDALTTLQNGAGEKVVFDPAYGNIWYWDLSVFAGKTYAEQLAGIQQLNVDTYFDTAQWHLATAQEMQPLWLLSTDVIRQTFNPGEVRYEGSYQWHYWSGRYADGFGGIHGASETGWGNFVFGPWDYAWPTIVNLSDVGVYSDQGAWVVATVPEPAAGTFLLVGMAVIFFASPFRRGPAHFA